MILAVKETEAGFQMLPKGRFQPLEIVFGCPHKTAYVLFVLDYVRRFAFLKALEHSLKKPISPTIPTPFGA